MARITCYAAVSVADKYQYTEDLLTLDACQPRECRRMIPAIMVGVVSCGQTTFFFCVWLGKKRSGNPSIEILCDGIARKLPGTGEC